MSNILSFKDAFKKREENKFRENKFKNKFIEAHAELSLIEEGYNAIRCNLNLIETGNNLGDLKFGTNCLKQEIKNIFVRLIFIGNEMDNYIKEVKKIK